MSRDPIVDEVRRAREDEAAKYGFDVKAILMASKRRQRRSRLKVVSLCAKKEVERLRGQTFACAHQTGVAAATSYSGMRASQSVRSWQRS